jgi:integrase
LFDRSGKRKYVNGQERKAYLKAAEAEINPQRRAFCLTLYYCGCRISEALNVTAERIDLAGQAITFETLKQRKSGQFRSVPIPNSLIELIRKILAGKMPRDRLWTFSRTTAYRLVTECMADGGINGSMACPKGLRHGFAVACIGQKIPLTTVQKWLGHGRLETTAIYLDVDGEEERNLAKRLWKMDLSV